MVVHKFATVGGVELVTSSAAGLRITNKVRNSALRCTAMTCHGERACACGT